MKTPAVAFALILMCMPSLAQAGERRSQASAQRWQHQRTAAEERRRERAERRAYDAVRQPEVSDDTPYGPIYQTQEQDMRSRYDVSIGKRGNIKEYWWRY